MPYKDKSKQAAWSREDKKKHPEKYRAYHERQRKLFRRVRGFGAVKIEIIEAIWLAQDKKCAICSVSIELNDHVDHDHDTGKIRGILCENCNPGLGQFKDNPILLERAAIYLRRYGK